MKKMVLHHTGVINGTFEPKRLNLLFVFQVNCPGCFIHGIPVVNHLVEKFQDRLPVLGLSTAFEDFDLNTEQHTEALVHHGQLVGATAQHFERFQEAIVPKVQFPVAFDALVPGSEFVTSAHLHHITQGNRKLEHLADGQKKVLNKQLSNYYGAQAIVPKSFTLNQLRGTLSFVFFNHQMKIVLEHFGGLDETRLVDWLTLNLEKEEV